MTPSAEHRYSRAMIFFSRRRPAPVNKRADCRQGKILPIVAYINCYCWQRFSCSQASQAGDFAANKRAIKAPAFETISSGQQLRRRRGVSEFWRLPVGKHSSQPQPPSSKGEQFEHRVARHSIGLGPSSPAFIAARSGHAAQSAVTHRATSKGIRARQLAWKISTLARNGTVRMPVVYGVMTHEEHPGPDVLLLERLRGVPVEAPTRTPARWEQLQEQIVEALLAWHRQDSGGCVGMVDNTQENLWPNWYRQRVEILWSTLNLYQDTGLTMQDKRLLFRSRECLPELFRDFNDNAVLVHGNFTLRSMLKRSAQRSAAGDGGAGDDAVGATRV